MEFWTDPDHWNYGSTCTQCGAGLMPHRFFLIYDTRHLDADLSVHTDEGEAIGELCSEACAVALEKLVTASLEPTALYPPLAKVAACAECGRDVNRLEPHLAMVQMECLAVEQNYAPNDGEREIAVFCPSCRPRGHADHVQEEISDEIEELACTTSLATSMVKT